MRLLALLLGVSMASCTQPEAGPPKAPDVLPPTSSGTAGPPSAAATTPPVAVEAKVVADDAPLVAGLVRFGGMVRPTKGGYLVRGVVLDDSDFARATATLPEGKAGPDGLLGAVVQVTAELVMATQPKPAGLDVAEQGRSGTFLSATKLHRVELTRAAEVLEGVLGRSKGMYRVGGRNFDESEVAWAFGPKGIKAGDKVRLFGQPRLYKCPPMAQCLVGGEIPLFDVGRVEKLP